MSKFFFIALLALLAGAALASVLTGDAGYVLVSLNNVAVETSLVLAVLLILLLFLLLAGVAWLLQRLRSLPPFASHGQVLRRLPRREKSRKASDKGLLLLSQGKTEEAYRLLLENARNVDSPLANYLAASLAAYREGNRAAWMYALEQARLSHADAGPAVSALRAQLELKSGNPQQSLPLLLKLRQQQPANTWLLLQLKDVYLALAQWEQLGLLLPELEKRELMEEKERQALQVRIGLYYLEQAVPPDLQAVHLSRNGGRAGQDGSAAEPSQSAQPATPAQGAGALSALQRAWDKVPRRYQDNADLLASYTSKLIILGQHQQAQGCLTRQLKQRWNPRLLALLAYVDGPEPAKLQHWLEKCRKERPDDAVLALTLGRLCLRCQQWEKAAEYFAQALRLSRSAVLSGEILAEQARLLAHQGELAASLEHYRQAMDRMNQTLPDLPMPQQ